MDLAAKRSPEQSIFIIRVDPCDPWFDVGSEVCSLDSEAKGKIECALRPVQPLSGCGDSGPGEVDLEQIELHGAARAVGNVIEARRRPMRQPSNPSFGCLTNRPVIANLRPALRDFSH